MRAAIMALSTPPSPISGTKSWAKLFPISGSPPEQVAAKRAAAVAASIEVPSSPKMAIMNFCLEASFILWKPFPPFFFMPPPCPGPVKSFSTPGMPDFMSLFKLSLAALAPPPFFLSLSFSSSIIAIII